MKKIKAAVLGMGFIGVSHVEAIRRIGSAQMIAVADTNYKLAKAKAEQYNIPKCYETVEELLADDCRNETVESLFGAAMWVF